MSDNIADVIAKVQKLLALAGNNTSENECKAARALADKLIQEHRLSMADLEAKGATSEPFADKKVSSAGRRRAWVEVILDALCIHYGGAWYYNSHREGGCGGRGGGEGGKGFASYTVIARVSDLAVIDYMLGYLTDQTDRLARWHTGGEGIAAFNGFRSGCASGIASQFRDMRASMKANAQSEQSCAIVLLDKRHTEANAHMNTTHKLKSGKSITGGRDYSARQRGYAEGRKVSLNQGLTGGTAKREAGGVSR